MMVATNRSFGPYCVNCDARANLAFDRFRDRSKTGINVPS